MKTKNKFIAVSLLMAATFLFIATAKNVLAGEACGNSNGRSCFPAGTKIIMADGSWKNIEEIKVGEKVISVDERTKKESISTVENLESPMREGYFIINDGLLRITDEHPIYIKKNNGAEGWGSLDPLKTKSDSSLKQVFLLEPGDQIYTTNGWLNFYKSQYINKSIRTYNLKTVKPLSTFFADSVLVHNKGGWVDVPPIDVTPAVIYLPCAGSLPANSQYCDAIHTYRSVAGSSFRSATLVDACDASKYCDAICSAGYIKSGNACVLPSCTGAAMPANTKLCPADDQGLVNNVERSLVSSCTAAKKCEYVCKTGYILEGNACVNKPPSDPIITGPTKGIEGIEYSFNIVSTDPDGDQVKYGIDWNDDDAIDQVVPGVNDSLRSCLRMSLDEIWNIHQGSCILYADSGVSQNTSQNWNDTGSKIFQAKARDHYGNESGWGVHTIVIDAPVPAQCASCPSGYTSCGDSPVDENTKYNIVENCSDMTTTCKCIPSAAIISSPECGSAAQQSFCKAPSRSMLCKAGSTASVVTLADNKWTWSCKKDAYTQSCSAVKDCSWTEVNP